MRYGKLKRMAACGLLLGFTCCLPGCSFSFCGFPIGDRETLVFACEDETAEGAAPAKAGQTGEESAASGAEASGESGAEAGETGGESAASGAKAEASGITADGKVNINTASAEELMTLNGVGETRAKAIIEYRDTYGPFQSKEDIMLIPGIKEGIFSKIEEQIVVQ